MTLPCATHRSAVAALIAAFMLSIVGVLPVAADSTAQSLPFSQNWSNTGLITTDDNWAGVPGVVGQLGQGLTATTAADPQTVVLPGTSFGDVDVIANQTATTLSQGGVAEFEIADPVVALQGSGTADAPHIILTLNTTGLANINIAYNLRDIDGGVESAIQPVALQYRLPGSIPFTNVPSGFVADATSGPSLATLVTPVSVALPAAVNDQALVEVRIITTNAVGSDEWVGIDDISVTTADPAPAVQSTTPSNSATGVTTDADVSLTFTEPVNVAGSWFTIACGTSGAHTAAVTGGPTTFTLNPDVDFASSEACTVTVVAAQVTDQDVNDPPDAMAANHVVSFTTAGAVVLADVNISQIYGGGGNTGATYRNDFIELFNPGASPVSLAGWSVQYASSTGTTWLVTPLSGSIPAGSHYLVQEAAGTGGVINLPTPDAVGTTAMSATNGKVALASSTTALVGSCPTGGAIIDLVGYGTANCFEGSAAAPGLTNTTAALRAGAGATDTDDNAADFATGAPTPRPTVDPAPTVAATTPAAGATGVALAANLSISFAEPVAVTSSWFTIVCVTSGTHSAIVTGGPITFTLDPDTDFADFESCGVTVVAAQVADLDTQDPPDPMAADHVFSFTTADIELCGDPATPIHDIQGSAPVSPLVGQQLAIEGVVVGDYQGTGSIGLGGFFVQEEDAGADANPATSEGIFVFDSAFGVPVAAGDHVRVRGTVTEFSTLTELNAVSLVLVCGAGAAVTPTTRSLPVAALADWEPVEGMLITIADELTVTETFTLGRFGEVALSVGGRLSTPTNVVAPGAPAIGLQDLNDRSRILLDDGRGGQNLDPTRYPTGGLAASNTLRIGDTVNGPLTGVLDFEFGVYRVQPVGPIGFVATNPRPAAPTAVGGNVRVASFNLLNYFNGDGLGGGFPTARGATTAFEFGRQRDKTISAIAALDADIVGLMELENDPTPNGAIGDLVAGLNAATAPGTYAFIDTGVVGGDEIRVGLIYQPASVTPVGSYAILDSSVDPAFIDTLNRPVIAQTFERTATGARLTVAVNHLKSKGSDCNAVGDPDTGDGQGNCNLTRTAAARALVDWLAADPTASGDPDALIIGDLNSYALEDPITAIRDAGYEDLIAAALGDAAYSYVFGGQSGYLDHALASASLAGQASGVTEWHVNADEPTVLDYNTEFKTANHIVTLYAPDAYRSSDHDPVLIGLELNASPTADAGGPYAVVEGETVLVTAVGSDPDGQALTYAWDLDGNGSFETPGQSVVFSAAGLQAPATLTIRVRVTDPEGLSGTDEATVNVIWAFGGFGKPIDGGSVVNEANSGGTVPVKFSLGGDQGLDIFRSGYPASQAYACGTTPPSDASQPIALGGAGLRYDSTLDEYILQWKTDKAWKNTCRVFVLGLRDGTNLTIAFHFK